MELATGYAALANGGYKISPWIIDRVEDEQGRVILVTDYAQVCRDCTETKMLPEQLAKNTEHEKPAQSPEEAVVATPMDDNQSGVQLNTALMVQNKVREDAASLLSDMDVAAQTENEKYVAPVRKIKIAKRIMEKRDNYLITHILQDVIRRGTAARARELGRNDLAGKTGTTNDQRDAWFSGYNQDIAATVWIGYDNHDPLGAVEAGSHAALPVWIDYMRVALKDKPERSRAQPTGIVNIRVDAKTGLLVSPYSTETIFELFKEEDVPTEESPASTADDESPAGSTRPVGATELF